MLKWTERNFYDRGLFPAVISGMDDHGPEHKAIAYTMIDSNSGTDRDAIKAAVQARKTWVSSDQNARVSSIIEGGRDDVQPLAPQAGSTVEILQDGNRSENRRSPATASRAR